MMAPVCKLAVCDTCVARHPLLFTRCSDCGAVACPDHTYLCQGCASPDELSCRARFGEVQFRAIMRCCACSRAYCFSCDGTYAGAGAFPESYSQDIDDWIDAEGAVRAPAKEADPCPWPWGDSGCIYCINSPGFCNALETLTLNDLECGLKYWADDVGDAEEDAAEAAQAATEAALAASELAIAASVMAEEARKTAAKAQARAAALARAGAMADELAARLRR